MHELPGMVRECVDLGAFIADRGYTLFMPLFFGEASERLSTLTATARLWVSREFTIFAQHESSPVTKERVDLAEHLREPPHLINDCEEGRLESR